MMNGKKNNPKISIIVPVYKVEQYLDRCIKSIVDQTYEDIEIILVDDGSTDNCPKMCDDWEKKDNRIKVIHKQNGGLSDARNVGINAANGKYVLFVDSDDYIDLDACEQLIKFTLSDEIDVVIGDAKVNTKDQITYLKHRDEIKNIVMSGTDFIKSEMPINKAYCPVWLKLYRTKFLVENKLYNKKGRIHEDNEFTPRVFIKAQKVVYSGVCFYNYIIRENSICNQKNLIRNAEHLIETCYELEKINNKLDDEVLVKVLNNYIVDIYLNTFQSAKLYKNKYNYIIKNDFLKNKAMTSKNKMKVVLFCFSKKLYYAINKVSKSL